MSPAKSRGSGRPSVAVDTALLTLLPDDSGVPVLSVLQVRREGDRGWGLPATFLHEGERLIDAVLRSLHEKAGVEGLRPRQLQVFDDPGRDDDGWVLSVAYVDAGPLERLDDRLEATRLMPADSPGRLPNGHGDVVRLAVEDLRERYERAPDPDGFLPEAFTVRELRLVHEAIAGRPLQRDTFRRAMDGRLVATGEAYVGLRGRPAELFRRG